MAKKNKKTSSVKTKADVVDELYKNFLALQDRLDNAIIKKFNRSNPTIENLTDWKKRGEKLFGKNKNITIYNTATVAGKVKVGKNTWIGPYTALDGGGGLVIGENCSISAGVNIVSHDSVKWALSGGKHPYEYGPIKIGDNCFIGTGAFISKGVTIGNHCLIGAGAVVTSDIPDYSIALGVPARVKGKVKLKGKKVTLVFE